MNFLIVNTKTTALSLVALFHLTKVFLLTQKKRRWWQRRALKIAECFRLRL